MTSSADSILASVRGYYAARLAEFGPQPCGVDWSTPHSQRLRFEKLLGVIDQERPFSLNDWGCGYGALLDYLAEAGGCTNYVGYDISEEMILAARERHGGSLATHAFVCNEQELRRAQFTVASGVFNVKLSYPDAQWAEYMAVTVDRMAALSERGFAFNALSLYSDPERRRPDLYYADPAYWFDYCKTKHSRFVTLVHDYPLWEFTLIIRRQP